MTTHKGAKTTKTLFLAARNYGKKMAISLPLLFTPISVMANGDNKLKKLVKSSRNNDDIIKTAEDYFFQGITFAALILCAIALIAVISSAVSTYSQIQDGKKTWKDLGLTVLVGVILIVVVAFLATKATELK